MDFRKVNADFEYLKNEALASQEKIADLQEKPHIRTLSLLEFLSFLELSGAGPPGWC